MQKLLIVPGTLFVVLLAGCSGSPGSFAPPQSSSPPSSGTTNPLGAVSNTSGGWPEISGSNGGAAIGAVSGRFTAAGNLIFAAAGHTATALQNGNILVAGAGQLDIDDLLISFSSSAIVTPSGQVTAADSLYVPREFHTATLLQNGKVLITGGNVFFGYPTWLLATNSAELYDPATGHFTVTGSMTEARTGHTASLLPDGRVLIVGGTTSGNPSAEIYDPATATFAPTGRPLDSRSSHTATVLSSGKILITGGRNASGTLASAEIYDASTGTFTAVGNMAEQRSHHTATLLANGKVLVAGGGLASLTGFGGDLTISPQQTVIASRTAEIFDPQTGKFTSAGTMNVARSSHTATRLVDGTVLLCGGAGAFVNGYISNSTAEIYDPASGSFQPAGNMNTGKFWHTATALPNGTVVLIGGIDQDWPLNLVEIFK